MRRIILNTQTFLSIYYCNECYAKHSHQSKQIIHTWQSNGVIFIFDVFSKKKITLNRGINYAAESIAICRAIFIIGGDCCLSTFKINFAKKKTYAYGVYVSNEAPL